VPSSSSGAARGNSSGLFVTDSVFFSFFFVFHPLEIQAGHLKFQRCHFIF
jgi:hypothetical protein